MKICMKKGILLQKVHKTRENNANLIQTKMWYIAIFITTFFFEKKEEKHFERRNYEKCDMA